MSDLQILKAFDPDVFQAIENEENRQLEKLELIASENIVSPNVLAAISNVMTNKYAEGYPGKRYYGGCENVDVTEQLAIDRAKELFQAEFANVQPHSGSQANMAVYLSILRPGDKIMGMDLSHGGHLTHGSPVNFSGILYEALFYGVRQDNQQIDYDQLRSLVLKHRPKMLIAGASAYPRILDFKLFRQIADEVGAYLVTDMAHIAGLVAAQEHPNPVTESHYVTTTTHKTLRGPRGGLILCKEENSKAVNSKIFPGIQGGPLCHTIAAKAVAFKEALMPNFKRYAQQVIANAQAMAKAMIEKGYHVTTGGTENHLILVDLSNKNISGKEAERALDLANITVNKNTVPFEKRSPFVTSGIRLGSPALTSRGFVEQDFYQVVNFIDQALQAASQEDKLQKISQQVQEFSRSFPLFKQDWVT